MESELFGHEKGAFTGAVAARPGCFEMANRGTLFLDEIAEMPINLQPKFLRTLENGRVRRLGGSQASRPSTCGCWPPPTACPRRRLSKKGACARTSTTGSTCSRSSCPPSETASRTSPSSRTTSWGTSTPSTVPRWRGSAPRPWECLQSYAWPGNVRELRNVVERAVHPRPIGLDGTRPPPPYLASRPTARGLIQPVAGLTMVEAENAPDSGNPQGGREQQGRGGPASGRRREDHPEQAESLRRGRGRMRVSTRLASGSGLVLLVLLGVLGYEVAQPRRLADIHRPWPIRASRPRSWPRNSSTIWGSWRRRPGRPS